MSNHWAYNYIGLRWEEGSPGPNAYDCWSLAKHILETYYNTPLPKLGGAYLILMLSKQGYYYAMIVNTLIGKRLKWVQ